MILLFTNATGLNFSRPDLQNSPRVREILNHKENLRTNPILTYIQIRYILLLYDPRERNIRFTDYVAG